MAARDLRIETLLKATVDAGASDLHLTPGRPPIARRDGQLVAFEGTDALDDVDTGRFAVALVDEGQLYELNTRKQVDFSFGLSGVGRFRVNVFRQRGSYTLALRVIPTHIRSLEDLGAPPVLNKLLSRPYGLVLAVGPTGSGKSTTLAAMIDRINATRPCHILTIEDPVEYLHHHQVAMVNQREVGSDVIDFEDGLRAALREDPDVILLGEMRDLESISIALTLAETGHLVFATLHTNDAAQAFDRVVDVFPAERRDQIQVQLASTLQGVVSQRLVKSATGGRVAAYEVLVATDAVRNLLREGKSRQLRNVMISAQSDGMQTLEMDLARLVASGSVDLETAMAASAHPNEVKHLLATQRVQARGQTTASQPTSHPGAMGPSGASIHSGGYVVEVR